MHLINFISIVYSYTRVCYGSKAGEIPIELYENIGSWTGNTSAFMINKASYHRLSNKIKATKELESIIHGINNGSNITLWPWAAINEITQNVQFFRPFIIKRSQSLKISLAKISKNRWKSHSKFAYRVFGMNALTISQYHNLTIPESFNLTESARKKLKILVGTSRATCCPYSADSGWNENDTITQQMQRWQIEIDRNFPWIIKEGGTNLIFIHLLMHYVWNNFHREMGMPPLESVMHLTGDEDECQFLKLLTIRHGLVFRPYALQRLWKDNFDKVVSFAKSNRSSIFAVPSVVFIFELLDAERLSQIFLDDVDFASDFMTELILEWVMRLNLTASTQKASWLIGHETPEYCVDLMLELMWFHYDTSGRQSDKCWKLLDVIKIIAFRFDAKQKMEQPNTSWSEHFRDDIFFRSKPHNVSNEYPWQHDYLLFCYMLLCIALGIAGWIQNRELWNLTQCPVQNPCESFFFVWMALTMCYVFLRQLP